MTVFYHYSRTDGAYQGNGVLEIQNAEIGSTEMEYDGDEDSICYFDGERWGDTPVPHGPPERVLPRPVVPETVSRFQARAALYLQGLYGAVEAVMNDPDTDMVTRLAWADAQEFERNSPTVAAIAGLLGLSDEQVDALFVLASGIRA